MLQVINSVVPYARQLEHQNELSSDLIQTREYRQAKTNEKLSQTFTQLWISHTSCGLLKCDFAFRYFTTIVPNTLTHPMAQTTRSLTRLPLNPYALKLLHELGVPSLNKSALEAEHPARQMAESGLMTLPASSIPVLCPVPLADCANGTLNAFRALSDIDVLPGTSGAELLTERAAIISRKADDSAQRRCRLLSTSDGVIALNLARAEDQELIPAWLKLPELIGWEGIESALLTRPTQALLDRGRLLGLAVADATQIPSSPANWLKTTAVRRPVTSKRKGPRVIDLSSLWAGPLCSHLWQAAGADVIKIESSQRPDGARAGPVEFFDLLNSGKECITLDLHRESGRRELHELMKSADIVLEASRPRALQQMGIIATELVAETPGLTWVSITGYGRDEPNGNWVGYGDDAAIAAGLSAILHSATGQWLVCGDAIADPLTGMHAALAGWSSWNTGGGQLLELSLEGSVRHCITATAPENNNYRDRQQRWQDYLQRHNICPSHPRRRNEISSSAHS